MKLLSIELENIFAYDRPVKVELDVSTSDRNIILIWGRNGMGKTSFLNSLKLLFLGADPPQMRTVGFPPRILPRGQYVLGDESGWSGVINRKALHRARTAGTQVTARVKARWEAADGVLVTAERQWTTMNGSYVESLSLSDGQELLKGPPAEDRLKDFMPPEYVGFFFFDGDDIKHLAESDDRKQHDFDRLLRLSFLNDLAEELRNLASERGRHRVPDQLREQIGQMEVALARAKVERETAQKKLADLEDLISADHAELRRLQARRENLSAGASEAQHAAMEERLADLRVQLDEDEYAVSEAVPASAPIIANLNLVRLATSAAEERVSAVGGAEQVLARRIQDELPRWIAAAPAGLAPDVVHSVAISVSRRIEEMVTPRGEVGLFGRLEATRADRLVKQLQRALLVARERRDDQVRQLALVRRLRREIAETREALIRLEVGSQINLEEYRRVTARIETVDRELAAYNQQKGQAQARLQEAGSQETEYLERVRVLRIQEENELKSAKEERFILTLAGIMDDLREALRREKRREVEELINERFRSLIYEHPLIDRIQLDDNYTLTFLDSSERPVGRRSLSSGLKQLAATALLWAMKDAVGREMPVVIDTPLGRIDRENQDHMLTNYYPNLSSQVIVLPTNTEIDRRKWEKLRPMIAREYKIVNSSGESAEIQRGSLIGDGADG